MQKEEITIREIQLGSLRFTCRVAGNPEKPAVIMLHGFPETSHMWEPLMRELVAAGYFCIAPDQRGYSPGARFRKKKHYHLEYLVKDVAALADHFGLERFHLVGHDWGAAVGWAFIAYYPERLLSWSALSVPHIKAFSDGFTKDPQQREMSGYIRQFQWPLIPEFLLKRKNYRLLRKLWTDSSEEQKAIYMQTFRERGAIRAALNWYRGNYTMLKTGEAPQMLEDVHLPTLFIWGEKDVAIGRKSVEWGAAFMKGPYNFVALDAGHWLIQEKTAEVCELVREHIQRYQP